MVIFTGINDKEVHLADFFFKEFFDLIGMIHFGGAAV